MVLKSSAEGFLATLSRLFGLVESDLQVIKLRGSKRKADTVGYYSKMSQFRTRCRVYVNVDYIAGCYMSASLAEEEIRKTIAYGYAMSMLEAIKTLKGGPDEMSVPDWSVEFAADDNLFAEDFARLCVTFDALNESFWDSFMVAYSREYHRVFSGVRVD